MHVRMLVCIHKCMYIIYLYLCTYVCENVSHGVCMHVCIHAQLHTHAYTLRTCDTLMITYCTKSCFVSIGPTSSVYDVIFDCNDIPGAFAILAAEVSKLLRKAEFPLLRRAILQHKSVPKGVQLPDDLNKEIRDAKDLDTLLDALAGTKYWSWIDLRLMEALIKSSRIREAADLISRYKEIVFSKKLSDVLDKMFIPQKKKHKDAYTSKVAGKLEKNADEITIGDVSEFQIQLEAVIMDINMGSCALEHLKDGCLEIHWLIPTHCRFHAYKSALNNRHKFCDIHLQYLDIEPYLPIYDPFTIQPAVLSNLLHLSKPIACKLYIYQHTYVNAYLLDY